MEGVNIACHNENPPGGLAGLGFGGWGVVGAGVVFLVVGDERESRLSCLTLYQSRQRVLRYSQR